jgi:hypothetical protein
MECEHGELARSCYICELESRIKELEQQLEGQTDEMKRLLLINYELEQCLLQEATVKGRILELEQQLEEAHTELMRSIKDQIWLGDQVLELKHQLEKAEFDLTLKVIKADSEQVADYVAEFEDQLESQTDEIKRLLLINDELDSKAYINGELYNKEYLKNAKLVEALEKIRKTFCTMENRTACFMQDTAAAALKEMEVKGEL